MSYIVKTSKTMKAELHAMMRVAIMQDWKIKISEKQKANRKARMQRKVVFSYQFAVFSTNKNQEIL